MASQSDETRNSFLPISTKRCIENEETWGKQSIWPWNKKNMKVQYQPELQGFDNSGKYYTSFCKNYLSPNEIAVYSYNKESQKLEAHIIQLKTKGIVNYDPKTTRWFNVTFPGTLRQELEGEMVTLHVLKVQSEVLRDHFGASIKIDPSKIDVMESVLIPMDYDWKYIGNDIHKTEKHGHFFSILMQSKADRKYFLYLVDFDDGKLSQNNHFTTITISDIPFFDRGKLFGLTAMNLKVFLDFDAKRFYIVDSERIVNDVRNGRASTAKDYVNFGRMYGFDFEGKKLLFNLPIVRKEDENPHYWRFMTQYSGSKFLVVWLENFEVEIFDATTDVLVRLKNFPLNIDLTNASQFADFQMIKSLGKQYLSFKYVNDGIDSISVYDLDSGKQVVSYKHSGALYTYDLNLTKELATSSYSGLIKATLKVENVENFFTS